MLLQLLLAVVTYKHLLVLLLLRSRLLMEAHLADRPPMLVCDVGV